MGSNLDLERKLRSWLEPLPERSTPLQVAVSATALKKYLQKDQNNLSTGSKSAALSYLDNICYIAYNMSTAPKGGDHKQRKKERDFFKKNNIRASETGLLEIPPKYAEQFNKLASPQKRKFLDKAEKLSRKTNASYIDLEQKITGAFRKDPITGFYPHSPEAFRALDHNKEVLNMCLAENMHPLIKHEWETVKLKDGPKTSMEMALCAIMLIKSLEAQDLAHKLWNTPKPYHYDDTIKAAKNIVHVINTEMKSDLPAQRINSLYEEKYKNVAHNALSGAHCSTSRFVDLMHYYLEHNQEKIALSAYAKLRTAHEKCRETMIISTYKDFGIEIDQQESDRIAEEVIGQYDTMFEQYSKPQINDILGDLQKQSTQSNKNLRNFQELEKLLDQRPNGMQEIVLLHYKESDFIRKMRQSVFKAKWNPDGGDGPKRAFIKDLAQNHSDDLRDIGFSETDIDDMLETGKLPQDCGYNIEHIIDREHGGTNHDHNFILMPEDINQAKDRLKTLQKALNENADEGCWIISWVPEKLPDGTYPKIFKGHVQLNELEFDTTDNQCEENTLSL